MGGFSLARTTGLVGLLLAAVTFSVADDLPDCNGYPVYLSVTPAQPGCDDAVTLGATQFLNDTCWTAEPPVFFDQPPDFAFELASIDTWDPTVGCLPMILEIPFTRQVGPLPAGPYSLSVLHTSTSPRHGDDACADWIPFDVTCCAELPAEAEALRVGSPTAGTNELWLSWRDADSVDDYVVFGADSPADPFTLQVATASSGAVGVHLPIHAVPEFFVVAGRNECGVGPRH